MSGAPPTMRHEFSGDPWGRCSQCGHPVYHEIHYVEHADSRNLVDDETAERNRTGHPGGYTFNALTPDDYAGIVLVFACVRIGDHAHIHVESGRQTPQPARSHPAMTRGFAGKLILRWHEWLVLRAILDTDPRVRIAEVEQPTPEMAVRYAGDRP